MLKSVGSTWITTLARIGLVFLLTPFVIRTLGVDAYGVWLTITAITSYLNEIRGGLPAASVKYVAEAVGAAYEPEGPRDRDSVVAARIYGVNRVVHSALWLYLVLAVVCAILGVGLLLGWQAVGRPVPEALDLQARIGFALLVVYVAFGFVAHLPGAVLEAHGDFVPRNSVTLGSIALQAVLTVTLLTISPNILFLAITLIACATFEILAGIAVVQRKHPGVTWGVSEHDPHLTRRLLRYSAWVLVLAVGGRLAFNTDAIIISTFDSYDGVAYYSIANSVALYFMEFVAAIAVVVMPRVAQLRAAGREPELRAVFLRWSKASMSLALLVGTFLLFMGPEFLGFWINEEFQRAAGPALQVLIASFIVFLPLRGAGVPTLMAVGDIRAPSIAFAVMGVVNVAISIALVPRLGILGAAIGTAIPNVAFALFVFQLTCAEARVPQTEYLRYVVLRPLLGATPVLAWLLVCTLVIDTRGFTGLLLSGVGTVAIFTAMQFAYVYRKDPYADDAHVRFATRVAQRLGLMR